MKLSPKEYAARKESGYALYRWMKAVTHALNDSTIRNKFFRVQVLMVQEAFRTFEAGLGIESEKQTVPKQRKKRIK